MATEKRRTETKDSERVPDVAGAKRLQRIRAIGLDLHSDGIDHWQDEPQPAAQEPDSGEGAAENGSDEDASGDDRA